MNQDGANINSHPINHLLCETVARRIVAAVKREGGRKGGGGWRREREGEGEAKRERVRRGRGRMREGERDEGEIYTSLLRKSIYYVIITLSC